MRVICFIISHFLLVYFAQSQSTFIKSIDIDNQSDEGVAIRSIQDGYLIMAGSRCYSNSLDCYSILKTNGNGELIWKKQLKNQFATIKPVDGYGNHGISTISNSNEIFYSGIVKNDDTLLDCFVMKTDSLGDSIWFKEYGSPYNDFSSALFQRTDTTLLMLSDLSSDPDNDVIWLLEIDFDGNIIWEKTFGELNKNVARQDIIQLDNGDIVFTHFSCERKEVCYFGDTISLNITRIDKNGTVLWTEKAYNFTEYWSFSSMISLDNGGFLLSFHRTNFESGWWYPPILIWLDSTGKVVNEYHFSEVPESIINDVIKTSSGEIVGVGYVDKFELGFAGWIFSLSQDGDLLWNREIVDLRYPARLLSFNAIEELSNKQLIVTGFIMDTLTNISPAANNKNIVLVKLDSVGCLNSGCGDLQLVSISDEKNYTGPELVIYPNPVNDVLCWESKLNNFAKINKISIFDNIGRLMYSKCPDLENNCIDVSDLNIGVYYCEITDSATYIKTFSFIIIN